MPVDLGPATSILQAYAQGVDIRLRKQKLLQDEMYRQARLEQDKKEAADRQKILQDQLKALTDYRSAELEHQQAQLDYQKAVEAARTKRENAKLKSDWLSDYAVGKKAFPQGQYEGTGEEFEDVSSALPNEISPFEGVTINRAELPPVYGPKEQQEDLFKRMEAQFIHQNELENLREEGREKRQTAALNQQAELADKRFANQLALLEKKKQEDEASDSMVEQIVRGNRTVPPAMLKKFSDKLSRYDWKEWNAVHPDNPSYGYIDKDASAKKELADTTISRTAVEFGFEFAQALEDWLQGTNKEYYLKKQTTPFAEVVRLARNVDNLVPGLRGGSNLGVLSKSDLALLKSNVADITGGLSEMLLRRKLLSGDSWGMQRAIAMARKYQSSINNLIGDVPAGQADYEKKVKYKTLPKLRPNHIQLLGGQ